MQLPCQTLLCVSLMLNDTQVPRSAAFENLQGAYSSCLHLAVSEVLVSGVCNNEKDVYSVTVAGHYHGR